MEKINVAELLKDCPNGMELDCTMYEDVYFDYVDELNIIHCYIQHETYKTSITFNQHGTPNSDIKSKCVIFPKGKTTWEGFVPSCKFKDGDILTTNINSIFIFSHLELDKNADRNMCKAYVGIRDTMPIDLFHTEQSDTFGPYESMCRLATEDEKTKLFDAIKENGYVWNPENKTLEKLIESKEDIENKTVLAGIYFNRDYYADEVELHLNNYEIEIRDGKTYAIFKNKETKISKPKFKDGDKVKLKSGDEFGFITQVTDCFYVIKNKNHTHYWPIKNQDDWELVSNTNKFDITTLVPFESRVLIRDNKLQKWSPAIWGFYDPDTQDYQYKLVGVIARYCIPYKGNEHLLGTTNDCDEYFKSWK